MEKTHCYTYFAVTGTFNPDEISKRLNLQPTEKWAIGDSRKDGSKHTFSNWRYGDCNDYDVNVENQMRKTISNLISLKADLLRIKKDYDAHFRLQVVPRIYTNEISPNLSPPRDIIEFLYETETNLDIDLYVYDE